VARGSQGTTGQVSQRVWLPPVAAWSNVIAGTGYIKSANDESLAGDEGGCSNLFMEVVTYKTVQGRQLRMTPATATFFPSVDAVARRTIELRRGNVRAYDIQAAIVPRTTCESDQPGTDTCFVDYFNKLE
jgi:hypothetical protein